MQYIILNNDKTPAEKLADGGHALKEVKKKMSFCEENFDEAYELLEKLCTENRITHEEYSLLWDCVNEALDCQIHAEGDYTYDFSICGKYLLWNRSSISRLGAARNAIRVVLRDC